MKTADSQLISLFPAVSGLVPSAIGLLPEFKPTIPPPYNVYAMLEDSGTLTLYATVLVPQLLTGPDSSRPSIEIPFNVTQVFSLDPDGNPKLQFYFCYNGAYDSRSLTEVHYRLPASCDVLPSGFEAKDVITVEVFLWDEDPKTSRGTVTTVTPAF